MVNNKSRQAPDPQLEPNLNPQLEPDLNPDLKPDLQPQRLVPLWLKLIYTAFCAVLVPVYLVETGPTHFLWFCDIALLGTMVALWLENRMLACMMALSAVFLDLNWNIDFAVHLTTGWSPMGFTNYMFRDSIPLTNRLLSLFHCPLPFIQIWLVRKLGYARKALIYQSLFGWAITWLTYLLSEAGIVDPALNINRVYGIADTHQTTFPKLVYTTGMMGVVFGFYLPVHIAFRFFCPIKTEAPSEKKPAEKKPVEAESEAESSEEESSNVG